MTPTITSKQLPCGKRRRWACSMNPVNVSVAHGGGLLSFAPEACVWTVFFGSCFGTEARTPLVKHITQMCHKRGCAWTVQKPSVSHLEQPLTKRWHSSLLLFRVYFHHLWQWRDRGGSQCVIAPPPESNRRQHLRTQRGRRGNVKTKDNETHQGRLKKSLKVSAGHFIPSATWVETVPLHFNLPSPPPHSLCH